MRSIRYRRIRAIAILASGVASVIAVVLIPNASTPGHRMATRVHPSASGVAKSLSSGLPAAESGTLPWALPNPISRLLLLPGQGNQVVIAGGLSAGGASEPGVYTLNTTNGDLTWAANLTGPLHDASGAALAGRYLVFGGGSSSSVAGVQSLPAGALQAAGSSGTSAGTGGVGAAPTLTATPTGNLPQPRSDSTAVTIGSSAYLVGGYDGSAPDSSVLATTNGVDFSTVASLRVPVRYPAVAALGRMLIVFGGLAVGGADPGQPVSVIQQVDTSTGKVTVVGSLPEPLYGAAAATLAGVAYLAGGMTGSGGAHHPVRSIWAYDPTSRRMLLAGRLRVPVAHAGAAVVGSRLWLVGGETTGSMAVSTVQLVQPNRSFGTAGAPGAGSPYFGDKLLVADEGNDRLLLLSDTGAIVWKYPSAGAPAPPGGFSADDAFFARHGTMIVTNEETEDVLAEVAYPSGKILWTYGHFGIRGSTPGYLNTPDDAYLLPDGNVVTADIANCRVIIIDPATNQIVTQIGTTGRCIHDMDTPIALGSPNGDTPLPNGDILVSEINGSYVDEFTQQGKPLWSVHLPISYPSDPQQIGPNRYLIAGYTKPGSLLEFNRQGQVLFRYQPASGPGMLDHPSLVEMLPNGILMLNDDHNDRMIAIDPATGALVWQYGVTHTPGSSPGMLNEPDGFDILAPGGLTPTHTGTG